MTVSRVLGSAAVAPDRWVPLDLDRFDRTPQLSQVERSALRSLGWNLRRHGRSDLTGSEWPCVHRLLLPLDAARASMRDVPDTMLNRRMQRDAASLILHRSIELGISFWGWTEQQWSDLIGSDEHAFTKPWPNWVSRGVRPCVVTYAYLLGGFTAFRLIGLVSRIDMARRVFGREAVDAAIQEILSVLQGWGYQQSVHSKQRSVICHLLLCNRSPYLTELSDHAILSARGSTPADRSNNATLHGVHRALATLGHVAPPRVPPSIKPQVSEPAIVEWMRWVDRWYETSTLTPKVRRIYRSMLTQTGRWMAAEYVAGQSPELWTRQICAAWVARVDRLQVGEYAQPPAHLISRAGQPLFPASKAGYLSATRIFFRDCQSWGWIKPCFDPRTALATPRSIASLIGPDPRVIADDIWAKLLWAGINFTSDDLVGNIGRCYPFELLRAMTMAWLFGGLRSDELLRLRVGCIRWEQQEAGARGSCLLDVPVHKTGTAFTKPVDPLLGQAIAAWEAIRPAQPPLADRKTGERVDLLFAFRARRVSLDFINSAIIPILCRKAGVPQRDARGRITSHRARSTIATQLYNAKEPMTLLELKAWLGHRSLSSTQSYTKIVPTRLARAYDDAGYFARNVRTIEVLIDRGAIQDGTAAAGAHPWQHYDLGHGYCGYTFFEQCPHRMACARCDFYTPKNSTAAQLLEAKAGTQHVLAQISLTDDERAAVESDALALDRLSDKLRDTATPAGPTPRQLGNLSPAKGGTNPMGAFDAASDST